MAGKLNNDNKAHDLTVEEQRAGGVASGEARREKATMRKTLEMCLEMKNKQGVPYKELVTLGLLKGAMNGNASNYRSIVEMLGELNIIGSVEEQPVLKVEITDNSKLEGVMYEANRHNKDDDTKQS